MIILKNNGLNPDEDVTVAPVNDQSAIVAGIKRGKYDGSFYGVGIGDQAIPDGSAELWFSLANGDVDGFENMIGVVLITSSEFANENPEAVKAFHDTVADAQQMVEDDPKNAEKVLKNEVFTEMDPEVFDVSWSQAKTGYPERVYFTKDDWEHFVDTYQTSVDNDLSKIKYEDLVVPPARG